MQRLRPEVTRASLSPDGRLLACVEIEKGAKRGPLVIRRRDGGLDPIRVPGFSVARDEHCRPVWSADGRTLLVTETCRGGSDDNCDWILRARLFDLASLTLSGPLPTNDHYATDISRDGGRLLILSRPSTSRVAQMRADGQGNPRYLTPEEEYAYDPQLSPDGRRVLFRAGPRPVTVRRWPARLYMLEIATGRRVALDEPGGETAGFCWSASGHRVAYTWQSMPPHTPSVAEREISLFTCDADGGGRVKVTSRKHRPARRTSESIKFFEVVSWR